MKNLRKALRKAFKASLGAISIIKEFKDNVTADTDDSYNDHKY